MGYFHLSQEKTGKGSYVRGQWKEEGGGFTECYRRETQVKAKQTREGEGARKLEQIARISSRSSKAIQERPREKED